MNDVVMDGDAQEEMHQPARRGVGPRLYHKKSRMGCLRCKARRVKCDEARPACGGCSRHQMECSYPGTQARHTNASRSSSATRQILMRPIQPAETPSKSLAQCASGHESSSPGYGDPGSGATNPAPSSADSWVTPPTSSDPPFIPVSTGPGDLTALPPMTSHVSTPNPYPLCGPGTSSQAPTRAGENSHPSYELPREPSVISNSSSSPSRGSIVREASDYLSHLADPEILEIPESKERRLWELKLMHNYVQSQAQQYAGAKSMARHGAQPTPGVALQDSDLDPGNPDSNNAFGSFVWGREIPKLALESDAILYSMLASSALDMWSRAAGPREREQLEVLQHKYLAMAMREQRLAVGRLGRDNADTACMASLTILQNSFALVQVLPVRPWQPPLDWLRMGRGAGAVLIMARGYLGGEGAAKDERITRFISNTPRMEPEELFAAGNRTHLDWLLDNDRGHAGGGDDDRELEGGERSAAWVVYGKVLSFVGYMQRAIAARDPIYSVVRRLAGFAIYTPELYHELLAQRRPRAMVALAHFFKLWIPYDDVWQVGRSGENQVRGIYEDLPPEWRHKVEPIFDEYNLDRGA